VRPVAAILLLVAAFVPVACSGASVAGDDNGLEPIVDQWRGVLLSRGGELPFHMTVASPGSDPAGTVIGADVEAPFTTVFRQGAASYVMRFFGGDAAPVSELVVKMSPDGSELHGYWRFDDVVATEGLPAEVVLQMPFSATRADQRRFQRNDPALEVGPPEGIAALPTVAGPWRVRAQGEDIELDEVWRFTQEGERVLTQPADRSVLPAPGVPGASLEGIYRNGLLRLSSFDGHSAVLLHARATAAGELQGTVWLGDGEAVPWSAQRAENDR